MFFRTQLQDSFLLFHHFIYRESQRSRKDLLLSLVHQRKRKREKGEEGGGERGEEEEGGWIVWCPVMKKVLSPW